MRQRSEKDKSEIKLSERANRILEAVVRGYIETGVPVGSRTAVRKYGIELSPASVRNEMADLTELGFLKQTHVSSGREPTEKGIHYYLEHIADIGELSPEKKAQVEAMYPKEADDYRGVVRASSRVLASLTRYTGVVWSPGINVLPLRRIEFVKLPHHRIMAVLVSSGGWFQTSVFEWHERISSEALNRCADFLNERFEGMTLLKVRQKIIEQMKAEKAEYDRMLDRAFQLMNSALKPAGVEDEVFIDGQANLVESTEFADVEKMKTLFKAFEEKGFIVNLLSKALEGDDIRVLLSSEEKISTMPGLALILAGYGDIRDVRGTLGVIGPIRMDYPSVIPLVKYTAYYVSSLLSS